MKLIPANFLPEKTYHLEDDIDFSNADLNGVFNLNKINSCHVALDITNYEDTLIINCNIVCNLTLVSSYSLKIFDQEFKFKETLDFSFNQDDEDCSFVIEGNSIEMDKYILDLIITSIPTVVKMKGEKLPSTPEGVRIISEEQYEKEKAEKKDDRWSKLDDLEF